MQVHNEYITKYLNILTQIDALEAERKKIREALITFHKEGFDLKANGITVIEEFSYDYLKCMKKYKEKTGLDAPILIKPEHTEIIPETRELDVDTFTQLLERENIKIGTINYTVKRNYTVKKK